MPPDGHTLHDRAIAALEAHQAMLRAFEQEPARQRDLDEADVATRWTRWHDEVLTPTWAKRDAAITPLLSHPDWQRWHRAVWRDDHTVMFRTPMTWRPVAAAIAREGAR